MLNTVVILFVMSLIVFNLGKGMYCLLHDRGRSDRTVKALSWRIGLSISLFILLFVAFSQGWVHPHTLA